MTNSRTEASLSPPLAQTATTAFGEERRLVTALFCDLVGFTPLSERLDAEDVRELQTSYFELMRNEIVRFGGQVEKYAGDAVLALFGLPGAREDDAERAVRCAVSMLAELHQLADGVSERWNARLALRVGVNTGEAVGGAPDVPGSGAVALVTGDVVNTAARLQTAAPPNGIMVGEQTMRLARRSIAFGEAEFLDLKGKSEKVPAYPVIEIRGRMVERWEAGRRRTPLLGRENDIKTLLQSWERARRGNGQLVMVVADAGVGKSRLLAEVAELVSMEGDIRELRGRCSSHGEGVSLGLVADLLRNWLGIREQDEPQAVLARLISQVAAVLTTEDEGTRLLAIDVLGEVLGLPAGESLVAHAGAQARRQALIKSLRLLFSSVAGSHPTLVVLDDLQWIDGASQEVLGVVLADMPGLRVMVLAAQRPGRAIPWSEWSFVERLNLRPLDGRSAHAMARAVLGSAELSEALETYISERAGGNPYYIEELLQALRDAGGLHEQDGNVRLVASAAERLPATLTEIVLARLDRLDSQLRSLVQVASVIGRTFAVDLLSHVVGRIPAHLEPLLEELPRADVAYPRVAHRSEYIFKHVTLRDVAYNTLLQRRRQELHASIARAIEALYPSDEYVELVAYHYARTALHREAATWLERAGDRAAGIFANAAAIAHFEESRKRLGLANAKRCDLARLSAKLGGMFRVIAWYDEAVEELEQALALYRDVEDLEGMAKTAAQIGQAHFLRGARDEGIETLRATLAEAGDRMRKNASPGYVVLLLSLVEPLHDARRFEEALSVALEAEGAARNLDDPHVRTLIELWRCRALQGIGRFEEARRAGEEARGLARLLGDLDSSARSLLWLGEISLAQGRAAEAISLLQRALEVAETLGDLTLVAQALGRLGDAYTVSGEWDLARERYEAAVELVRSISYAYFSASALLSLGDHYLLRGENERASRYLEEPLVLAERSGRSEQLSYLQIPLARWDLFHGTPERALHRLQPLLDHARFNSPEDHRAMQAAAEAHLQKGDTPAAEALVAEGSAQASDHGDVLALASWLLLKGQLGQITGNPDESEPDLRSALALVREIPYPFLEARVLVALGQGLTGQGKSEEGMALLEQARAIFIRLGAAPYERRVEEVIAELATGSRS